MKLSLSQFFEMYEFAVSSLVTNSDWTLLDPLSISIHKFALRRGHCATPSGRIGHGLLRELHVPGFSRW